MYITSRLEGSVPIDIDPVMGDNGTLYSTFDNEMCWEMRKLAQSATLLIPNVTEASFLLEKEPKEVYTKEDIKELLAGVSRLSGGRAVITGVEENDTIGCIFTTDGGVTSGVAMNPTLNRHYPGTGDIFASVLVGSLMQGKGISKAVLDASSFVYSVMKYSMNFDYPAREGVLLEKKLHLLTNFS